MFSILFLSVHHSPDPKGLIWLSEWRLPSAYGYATWCYKRNRDPGKDAAVSIKW